MTWFSRLPFRLGLHRWTYNRKSDIEDAFPYTDTYDCATTPVGRCPPWPRPESAPSVH